LAKSNENSDVNLGDILAEGENVGITQQSPNTVENTEKTKDPVDNDTTNSLPFPSTQDQSNDDPPPHIPDDGDELQL
jgi:hypothetical protein